MGKKIRYREHVEARRRGSDERVVIYGIHAVAAAIANPSRTIHRALLSDNALLRLQPALTRRGSSFTAVLPRELDKELGAGVVHQGALVETEPLPEPALEDLAVGATALVLVLDQVTDPHNVGAVIRSAAAFGACGLVMTDRNSPPLSGALAKVASGGLEHVPVARVHNLARALDKLAELGFFRIGLDGDAPRLFEAADLSGRIALVLGAEEKGMRRLTRENTDATCRLATTGAIGSLNVSNAAAIALHHVRFAQARPGRAEDR